MANAQSADSGLAARLEQVEAREAIRRVVHEFSHGFDKRDMERFLRIWHPDAVWLVAPGYEAAGHDGLRAVAEQSWAQMATTNHWNCNEVIEVDGDRATGIVDVIALVQAEDGSWHQSAATYHDSYVRVGGGWLIERRTASIHATLSLGKAPAQHPWGDISDR